ncbi:MAG: hypothetical protein QOK05_573 [Chloroflexota bacterium]|jgi:uncharacterized repeat protein (TIGR01451 family)|nr:hypothetical protein [Chloroflexota bacterium]
MQKFDTKLVAAGVLGLATLLLAPMTALAGSTYDLTIQKSHTGNFTAGQNGTFTITVGETAQSSNGTGSDTITVTDVLPASLTFVSNTNGGDGWTCSASGQTVTCTAAPDMSPNGSTAFTLTVAVAQSAPCSVSNTATVSALGDSTVGGNNTSTDTVTVTGCASASPSPTASPTASPSPSPSPTAVTLPLAGAAGATGGPAPLAWAAVVALGTLLLGGVFVLARLRA